MSRLLFVVGMIMVAMSLFFILVGVGNFGENYWMAIAGVVGLATGYFLVKMTRPRKMHPIIEVLQTNPESLEKLEFTAYRFAGMGSSEMANIHAGKKVGTAYLADENEKFRFLKILHERASGLVPSPPVAPPESSTGKRALKSFGSAIYVVLVIIVIVVIRLYFRGGSDGPSRQDFRSSIEQHAEEANAQLPAMVDEETRLDSVEFQGGMVFYNHSLVNLNAGDIDRQHFKNAMETLISEAACLQSPQKDMIANDYPVVYAYHDASGTRFATITVDQEICGNLP
jgi:hypothetical protein